ncbi:MAG: radical SAM protein [Polyangiaceae bacterium]|nr:radical SAM protein [Polyangiaceae bacterium]
MLRIPVNTGCVPRCPGCFACPAEPREFALDNVLAHLDAPEILLGGGDSTRWRKLPEFLKGYRSMGDPKPRLWLEAPAKAFTPQVLSILKTHGVTGILIQIEGWGDAFCKALGVGEPTRVIANAESLDLQIQARLCIRPSTLKIVEPAAKALLPKTVWVEFSANDFASKSPETQSPIISAQALQKVMLKSANLHFTAHRQSDRGYLPPCLMPDLWQSRPVAWRTTFREHKPNTALQECGKCAIASLCQWNDKTLAQAEELKAPIPITDPHLPWEKPRSTEQQVPEAIIKKRRDPEVICVTPWTTMEIVDPDGRVRQCCSTWTKGDRGNAQKALLSEVWNGEGYQFARRVMAQKTVGDLCEPICSRLYDHKFSEKAFRIQSGSNAFVQNQLLLADEMAQKKEIIRAKPLKIAICPSTYCNYNCIMCDHGRSPRRELPESIWGELEGYLPTLSSLTLLGGEPLANPLAMKFLRNFDVAKFPDCQVDLVTNGSLLTDSTLKHLKKVTLGDVTVSLNAGTPDVYERVQRGIALREVIANIDRLIEHRRSHHRYFGITVSFVLQPAASHTLIEFGEIARTRGLRIRLMALNPENHEGLDFYEDNSLVAKVLSDTDRFLAYCKQVRPEWVSEVVAGRAAVLEEAAHRKTRQLPPEVKRLPIIMERSQ